MGTVEDAREDCYVDNWISVSVSKVWSWIRRLMMHTPQYEDCYVDNWISVSVSKVWSWIRRLMMHTPQYTASVFDTTTFDKYLAPLKDIECCFMEIGTFEGRSTNYLLTNWRKSVVFTIDPCTTYPIPGYENYIPITLYDTILTNLAPYLESKRCFYFCDYSHNVLPTLPMRCFDMVIVDGDHRADSVHSDAQLAWPHLKSGGLLIFDDYTWVPKGRKAGQYDEMCPKLGVDKFLEECSDYTLLQKGYTVVVKKGKD